MFLFNLSSALFVKSALLLLKAYQWTISPLLSIVFQSHCRFDPSCSRYAQQMLSTHGFFKGSILSLRRISHCHPWGSDELSRKENINGI